MREADVLQLIADRKPEWMHVAAEARTDGQPAWCLLGSPDWSSNCCYRWLKFEEDVEDGGERWSKPYVATLSLHSLFELRSCIINSTVLLDMRAHTIEEVAGETTASVMTTVLGSLAPALTNITTVLRCVVSTLWLRRLRAHQTWCWTIRSCTHRSERSSGRRCGKRC